MLHWRSMNPLLPLLLLCGLFGQNQCSDSPAAATRSPVNFTFTQPLYNVSVYQNAMTATRLIPSSPHMGVTLVGGRFPPERKGHPPWVDFRLRSRRDSSLFVVEANRVGDFYFLDLRTSHHTSNLDLNREKQARYVFAVIATYRAGSEPSEHMECTATVMVEVLDNNDNCPIFIQDKYNFTVSDDMPVGTALGRVEATDADVGINARIYYVMEEYTQHFRLDPYSGTLYLARVINAATFLKNHSFTLQAVERGGYNSEHLCMMVSRIQVYITVKATNRYPPKATIHALSAIHTPGRRGTVYAVIKVEDEDIGDGGLIDRVEIVNETALSDFTVRRVSSKEFSIVLRRDIVPQTLRSSEDVYLRIWDAGKPPRSTLIPHHVRFVTWDQYRLSLPKNINLTVSENALVNTIIHCLNVSMPFRLQNTEIVYNHDRIVANPFFVVHRTGAVVVNRPLDAETKPGPFILQVEAKDDNNFSGEKIVMTTLHIKVKDANDNPPVVRNAGKRVTVMENSPIGHSVLRINAFDPDQTRIPGAPPLLYTLINDAALPFGLDPKDPSHIVVDQHIDREIMPESFELTVRVSDRGPPLPRKTEARFLVSVLPMNDNPPVFKWKQCSVELGNRAVDVRTFAAIDLDDNTKVEYQFVEGYKHRCFSISRHTGHVSLNCSPHQLPAMTLLKLRAYDGQLESDDLPVIVKYKPELNSSISTDCKSSGIETRFKSLYNRRVAYLARLQHLESQERQKMGALLEKNSFPPQFAPETKKVIYVYEDKKVGSPLLRVLAEDKDNGQFSYAGRVVYAISDGNVDDTFQLVTHEEQTATLYLLRPLDRERRASYKLTLRACDLGSPSLCAKHKLRVQVSDVNDCAPVFARGRRRRIYVPEDTRVGAPLFRFNASDCDEGKFGRVRFRLRSHRRTFNITRNGLLALKSRLDRETQSRYLILIRAFNKAKAPMSSYLEFEVVVTDVNDNRPKFVPANRELTLMQDLPRRAYITTLHAIDPDEGLFGMIRYRLIGKDTSCFDYDAISGVVRLNCALDFTRKYQLIAVASDQGTPPLQAQTVVTVHVRGVHFNVRPPVFPPNQLHFEATVPENAAPDTVVTRLKATDPEQKPISYRVIGGSGMGRFRVSDQGVVRTNEVLDYETASSYWLLVEARDDDAVPLTAFSEIYIRVLDVNDNTPMPLQAEYTATVKENAPKGLVLARIQAYDMDGANSDNSTQLLYKITGGNELGFFYLNSTTGMLTTTAQKIDREAKKMFTLEVTISDQGKPELTSKVSVYVEVEDENDNKPWFLHTALHFKVFEVNITSNDSQNASSSSTPAEPEAIGRVMAFDKDALNNGSITFSLDNYEDVFRINPDTGHIYPITNLVAGQEFIVKVRATDGGKPPLSSVRLIKISCLPRPLPVPGRPISEGQLRFDEIDLYLTSEDTDQGLDAGYVSATDPDNVTRPLIFSIREERAPLAIEPMELAKGDTLHNSLFRIATRMDYEEQSSYNLTVCVSNGLQTICRPKVFKVSNVNEWRPVFDRAHQTVQVSETLAVGTEVLKLSAQDRDPGSQGLRYRIEYVAQEETRRMFKLDSYGALTVAQPLDHERISHHVMLIHVLDTMVGQTLHAACLLEVRVTDANEHAPQFLLGSNKQPHNATVRSNSPIDWRVIHLAAFDPDKGERNARLHYEITNGNWDRLFRIDEAGYVRVNASLERVASKIYQLEVTVTDNGRPPKSNRTTVIVHVVSLIERDRPRFLKKAEGRVLSENCPVGTVVAEMHAKSNGPILYRITKGNDLDLFSIADTNGLVTTKAPIDRERHGDYFSLTVEVRSADKPEKAQTDNATLSISVQDVNDNRPTVAVTNLAGWISEDARQGAVVHSEDGSGPLVIRASDPDYGHNGKLNFEFRSSSARQFFMIDEDTHAIRRRDHQLDREHIPLFVFSLMVTDRGRPVRLSADQLVSVRIRVADINDNPPRFPIGTPDSLVVQLPAYAGKLLLRTGVQDPDQASDGKVRVRLRHGNEDGNFRVNSSTGDLYLAKDSLPPDRTFKLSFEATDGLYFAHHNISVHTRSGLRNSPNFAFAQTEYYTRVRENSTSVRDLILLAINASNRNEIHNFDLLNPNRFFTLGRATGVLRTTGVPLDREVDGVLMKLLVKASDRNGRVAYTWIHVTVDDINDCQPIFVKQPYHAVVKHSASPGTFITKVSAVDQDAGDNGRLLYSLHSVEPKTFPRPTQYFELRGDTGQLFLARRLPASVANKIFMLHLRVRDHGRPHILQNAAAINLQVVTRNTPVFEETSYQTTVSESAPPNEAVMTLNASSPHGATLIYSIMSGNEDEKFSLDFSSGVLKTVDTLDYETQKKYKLTIRVTETSVGLFSQVEANIHVKDVNDKRPVFAKESATAVLSEQTKVGETVLHITATDEDTGAGGTVSYTLEELEPGRVDSQSFSIDQNGGIRVIKTLDYETRPVHEFWVVASDDGTPRLSSRIPLKIELLDYNDNRPMFINQNYHVSIADDSLAGSFVVKVSAADADVNDTLSYSLQAIGRSGNDYRCFRIDASTGQIHYQPTAARSRTCNPSRSNYSLDVIASDGVNKALAHVVILMTPTNRHAPRFKPTHYNAFVSENMPPGTFVITVRAEDPDRGRFGQLTYSIMSEEHRWFFNVDPKSGSITTVRPIDRETHRSFRLLVTVQDGGKRLHHATVIVHVNDENDNAPAFRQERYRLNLIAGEMNPHKSLFQIRADDIDHGDNSTVRYYLHEPDDFTKSAVGIGDTTGEVRLGRGVSNASNLKMIVTEMEARRKLQFWVRASDQGKMRMSSLVEVEIFFMKIKPPFWPLIVNCKKLKDELSEYEKIDQPAAHCYADTRVNVEYSLLNGGLPRYNRDGRWFTIEPETGYIRTVSLLDRETTAKFELTVQVRASTEPPTYATTKVEFEIADRNDVTPHFQSTRYYLAVPENIQLQTPLMRIVATDEDMGAAGRFTYALTPPQLSKGVVEVNERVAKSLGVDIDVRSYFEIDGSGWLRNVRELDRETVAHFDFSVEVSNQGAHRNSTRVRIDIEDVNDNPMTWAEEKAADRVLVNESAPLSTEVYTLHLLDKDVFALEPVRFWLLGTASPALPPFSVEAETGRVIVSGQLDREKQASYLLEVMATDGKFSTTKPFRLSVTVTDADDNWPVCQQPFRRLDVEEGRLYNTLTRFTAIDRDEGINARLHYTLVEGDQEYFQLGSESGVLSITTPLNREVKSVHQLRVNVSDPSGHHCLFSARVDVADINNNAPVFVRPPAIGQVPEDATPGSPIGKVHAEDLDAGLNRRIDYSLAKAESHFTVDTRTGIVSVARPLDRERQAVHVLPIVASDQGRPPRSTTMTVSIRLLDVNDSPPVFERKVYERVVSEDAPSNEILVRVHAVSDDIGQNSVVRYKLYENFNLFSIDSISGELRLKNRLDFERAKEHYLTVLAVDRGQPPLTGQTMVLVRVRDVNDNPPRFPIGGFNASLVENAPPARLVMRVTAEDADSDANSRLAYRLVGGDPMGHFQLDERTGELRVNRPVDRERQSAFRLLVEAKDFGIPKRLSATTQVRIAVQDLNDCHPQFNQQQYTFVIYIDKDGNITNAGDNSNRLSEAIAGKIYATDADGPGNAGPFEFSIIHGDVHHFRLENRADHCVVSALGPLTPGDQDLTIRVTDAGRTPRSNTTRVRIRVVLQSKQPPSIDRLNVTLTFYRSSAAPSGAIAHVRVRNRSPNDRLRFSLTSDYAGLFHIDPVTGRLSATAQLDAGRYAVAVRVSNGSLSSNTTVYVRVVALTEEMLDNAFVLRLSSYTPKLFFMEHKDAAWRRVLGEVLRVRESSVYILAVQPAPHVKRRYRREALPRLDVLTAVYSDDERKFFRNTDVTRRLMPLMERLRREFGGGAVELFHDVCPRSGACVVGQGVCRSRPQVIAGALTRVNVMGVTHASPRFRMATHCDCKPNFGGARCEVKLNECARKPCKSPHVCQPMEGGKYRCVCPTGRKGDNCEDIDAETPPDVCRDPKCRRQRDMSPMMFKGGSYANWTLQRPNPRLLDLSFWVRTKQANAPFIKLRWAEHRAIQLYFANGRLVCAPMSLDAVAIRTTSIAALATSNKRSAQVPSFADESFYPSKIWLESPDRLDDGSWHRVRFRLALSDTGKPTRRWLVRLTIDGVKPTFKRVNWLEGSSRRQEMLMGAEVRSLLHGYTDVKRSFAGCVKDVLIGNVRLPQQSTYESSPAFLLSRKVEVQLGCSDEFLNSPCAASPCSNGGECEPSYGPYTGLPAQDYVCKCPAGFQGRRCDINTDPCSTNRCLNGGTCRSSGDSFVCLCPKGLTGKLCDYGRYCGPGVNPCRHEARCIESYTGAVCQCTPNFQGKYCDVDVDECSKLRHPCNKRGACKNSHGSYHCNCTLGYEGRRCEFQNLVRLTPDNNSWMLASSKVAWIIGGIFAVVIIALLLCLVIYFCVKYRRERRRRRRFQPSPMNDLQKGETHPMITLVTDSRSISHANQHCYDPLLGSGTRNSIVSSTGMPDIHSDNYVRYNDFSCPGTPNYSTHRLAQVGEESICPMVGPVTATSSQEGSDELDGPPSIHPLAQSTSSTSSNNNTVILPGNGRNGHYRPVARSKKKAADFYPPHMAFVTPMSAVDPRLRVNLESYASKQKSPNKMKTFRNMEEPDEQSLTPQPETEPQVPPVPPPRGGIPMPNKPDYFWDMSDVRPGLTDSPIAHHSRLGGPVGEEDELGLNLEDDLDGVLQEGQPLWPPEPPPATAPRVPPANAAARPLPTRTAAGVSQHPVVTVVGPSSDKRRSIPDKAPERAEEEEEEEILSDQRLSSLSAHPNLYLPPHTSSLASSQQSLGEEPPTAADNDGPPDRPPPPPPLADGEEDASDPDADATTPTAE